MNMMKSLLALASIIMSAQAFAPLPRATRPSISLSGGNPIANFFEELDNFIDDATSRRLGNGAAFYGKRKSNFYGEDDAGRKKDSNVADHTEDYQGPSSSGYFKWMPDDDGQMRPVSRMKEKSLERNPKFWDRQFGDDEE
uniref:Uncharacterized protein n=1 Tax=Leptocylindrus danicus TaxID=163516 RepID=A0A6U2SK75_9STRA|mmetsp:Transcript_6987/g.10433  ORF Transcript_6987/g.10433 Transcript_6987/m.10433 type:complete len:140 (+) Transcript_6987:80-499(+)